MDWTEIARIASFGGFSAGLAWFLANRFRTTETKLEGMLNSHEERDQRRHEENIVRFIKMEVKLDNLNGKH